MKNLPRNSQEEKVQNKFIKLKYEQKLDGLN